MFTGIIENLGTIISIEKSGSNIQYWIKSSLAIELKIDQSVSHNGVCMTVVEIDNDSYRVTAVEETLAITALCNWKVGDLVNLERSMKLGDRLDGHMVYGHVDTVGECIDYQDLDGSWQYTFMFDSKFKNYLVEKGSVALNGTSLTIFNVKSDSFSVAVIPYTYEHTSIKKIRKGSKINLEFDIFGKYVEKFLQNR